MPLESVEQAVGFLKKMCCEEYGDEVRLDEGSLHRHVHAMLADGEPPNVPANIVEYCVGPFLGLEMGVGRDEGEAEAMTGPVASPEQWRIAAKWAFLFYCDFFGEHPSTGDEDGWLVLTSAVQNLLHAKIFSPPLPSLPPLS